MQFKMIEIGKRIKDYRESLGISQRELGEKLGVSNQIISKWERGDQKDIPLSNLNMIAKALKVDIRDIIGWEKPYKKPADWEDKEKICLLMTPVLRECRAYPELAFLHYIKGEDGEKVIVKFEDPTVECKPTFIDVDVTADSGIAMIKDIIRALG